MRKVDKKWRNTDRYTSMCTVINDVVESWCSRGWAAVTSRASPVVLQLQRQAGWCELR